jgi:hypothetical protein
MRYTVLLSLLFFLTTASAAEISAVCIPAPNKIDGDNIILLGKTEQKTAQIYFFTNTSNKSLFIDHPSDNPGASAGWSTYLRPGNWAALALNKKNFTIHCSMITPGKVVALKCSDTISVYVPKQVTVATKLKGNYWLAEDKNWEMVVKSLEKKGIIISGQ